MAIGAWGKEVKKAMVQNGITMRQMAKDSGYSYTYLSAVINGKKKSQTLKRKISGYLGVSSVLSEEEK